MASWHWARPAFFYKRKAISALFPYAIRREQGGQHDIVDAITLAARASASIFTWHPIWTNVTTVFDSSSPPSLNRVIALALPYVFWYTNGGCNEEVVVRWRAAVSTVPYSEEVGTSVAGGLLHILFYHPDLLPLIPVSMWAWLKNLPALPPVSSVRPRRPHPAAARYVRGLGDIEIFKSYLLLVWSEWEGVDGIDEIETLIREDFGGIGMWCHRDDLIKRLDDVQRRLGSGLDYISWYREDIGERDIRVWVEQYRQLKSALVEMNTLSLTGTPRIPPSSFFISTLTIVGVFRIPLDLLLCFASSVPVISRSQPSMSLHHCSDLFHRFFDP